MNDAHTAVLDRGRLETLVEEIGDRSVVREAVATYLAELPVRLDAIRDAVGLGDPDVIRSAAHALGSPSSMLGAAAVTTTTRALQAATSAPDDTEGTELGALVGEIERACAATEHQMLDYLAGSLA
jgi:HPt (histidine-containing phosphotransfer) domain-containing protein